MPTKRPLTIKEWLKRGWNTKTALKNVPLVDLKVNWLSELVLPEEYSRAYHDEYDENWCIWVLEDGTAITFVDQ